MMEKSERSDQPMIERMDRILQLLQRTAKNNIQTLQIYIDICKEKTGISSKKLKEIYSLLSENKAMFILFSKEKSQLNLHQPQSHEAFIRLSWRFIERIVLKCSYFLLNKKHLKFISEHLIKLIKFHQSLTKNLNKVDSPSIMFSIIETLSRQNEKVEDQIYELLLSRGYLCSMDEFYSINGLKKKQEDTLYERTIFQENQIDEDDELPQFQEEEDQISEQKFRNKHKQGTGLFKRKSKNKLNTIKMNYHSSSKFKEEVEEEENMIKPTNFENWRNKRNKKTINLENLSQTVDDKFEILLTEVVSSDLFIKHVENNQNLKVLGEYFEDSEENKNDSKIFDKALSSKETQPNPILKFKRSESLSSSSKISSRLVEIMDRVAKENKKKEKKVPYRFPRAKNTFRASINLLMGEALLTRDGIDSDFNFNTQSSIKINSALTINSMKLSYGKVKIMSECKKSEISANDKENSEHFPLRQNRGEKHKEIEKELINRLVLKNHEKHNAEMFRNALNKYKHSNRSFLTKKIKSNKNSSIIEKQINKSIFAKINEEKRKKQQEKIEQEKIQQKQEKQKKVDDKPTFPEYCRHENIGLNPKAKKTHSGILFRVYDTRRRIMIN